MKVFKILFKIGFLKLSSYIEASIVNILSAVMYIVVQFFVWSAIVKNSSGLELSFMQMFSYIVYSQVILYLYPAAIGKQLGQMIKSGEISLALLKPLSLIKQLVFENIGVSFYKALFISIPTFVIGFLISGCRLCASNFLLFVFTLILSYIIYTYIDLLFGVLQFYTSSSWGINSLKYAIITLCSGRVLPLSIYPEWSRSILAVLPFKYLYDLPLNIVINEGGVSIPEEILKMGVWIMIMGGSFKILYDRAIKKISIMGG